MAVNGSVPEKMKSETRVWISLTCHCDVGCGFNVTIAAAVKSTVHQLGVFDGQLHDAKSISDLILEIVLKLLWASPPLHGQARLRQLTAQAHALLLLHLLAA